MRPYSMQTWLQNARNPISEDLRLKTSLGDNNPRPIYSRTPLAVLILKPPSLKYFIRFRLQLHTYSPRDREAN